MTTVTRPASKQYNFIKLKQLGAHMQSYTERETIFCGTFNGPAFDSPEKAK